MGDLKPEWNRALPNIFRCLLVELRPQICQLGIFDLPDSFIHLFVHSFIYSPIQQPSFLAVPWELQTQRGIRQALPSSRQGLGISIFAKSITLSMETLWPVARHFLCWTHPDQSQL